ncbi:hypothetical protein D3C87_1484900 [compost metagenome]
MFRQAADAKARHQQALDLVMLGRRCDDASRKPALIAKDRQRRQAVAQGVTGERHKVLVQQVFHADVGTPEQRVVLAAEQRIALLQE